MVGSALRFRNLLYVFCAGLTLTGGSAVSSACADTIGRAAVVTNVVKQIAPTAGPVDLGAEIIRDEVVQTGVESNARVVFADNTNLSMGPGATIRMDASVYSGGVARAVAAKLTAGAFRFVTGNGPKKDYSIETQLTTIGVRGTILDIWVLRGREIIVLQEGAAVVCIKGAGQCITLGRERDTVVVEVVNGKVRVTKTRRPPWTFAGLCHSNAALCGVTQFARAGSESPGPVDALCGR
jgi:hypothetical protein